MKATIFHSNEHTQIIISKSDITIEGSRENSNTFTLPSSHHTSVLEKITKLLTPHPMTFIHQKLLKQTLLCHMCTKMAQLKANKSPLLLSYLHIVNLDTYMPQWSLYLTHTHDCN